MARQALGRGLSGLIPQAKAKPEIQVEDEPESGLREIPVGKIKASRWQPRQKFDDSKLAALADSIREQGLVQPVIVRMAGDEFELIAGERRLRAVTMLGWEKVNACIIDASDQRMREMALVENLQRDDLNPIETAISYELLQKEEGLTHEDIARRLGVSRASITNTLRLLKLPGEVKEMVAGGDLSAGHARTILGLGDAMSQIELAKRIFREKIPVQEVEKIVKRMTDPHPASSKSGADRVAKPKETHVAALERQLRNKFGVKVDIDDKGGKGKIVIEYYSHDDIARIISVLGIDGE